MNRTIVVFLSLLVIITGNNRTFAQLTISGVYPHLAAFGPTSGKKNETGIGALVPRAGKLWFLTYDTEK